MAKNSLYLNKKYRLLKRSLSKEEKEKIKKVEKLCLDTKLDYSDICRRADEIVLGPLPHHYTRANLYLLKTPLVKLMDYLVRRAGEMRGIKFSE